MVRVNVNGSALEYAAAGSGTPIVLVHGSASGPMSDHQLGTVVIGGSQAGLAVGYYLEQRDLPFVILDENDRIGDAWRKRWDSLRLFTPGRYDGLPGTAFPGSPRAYPTKDDGLPIHDRGIVESYPGLYFIGLLFLYSLSSALVGGVAGCQAHRRAHRFHATIKKRRRCGQSDNPWEAVCVTRSCPYSSCSRASRTPRLPLNSALR